MGLQCSVELVDRDEAPVVDCRLALIAGNNLDVDDVMNSHFG